MWGSRVCVNCQLSRDYLQHERLCCLGYTNLSRKREFVYLIQHGHETKWLVKHLDENIPILQQFKINKLYLVRKLNLKFMYRFCIRYTNDFFYEVLMRFTMAFIIGKLIYIRYVDSHFVSLLF